MSGDEYANPEDDYGRYAASMEDPPMDDTSDGFVEEPPIEHNVYPDSENEDEDGMWAMQPVVRGDGNLYKGQIFTEKMHFMEAVLDHALKTGRNIMQNRYDKNKIGYNCEGGNCEWRVYCALKPHSIEWQIRVFTETHTCVPNGECKMLKVPVIAGLFVNKIREEPEYYMPMKIAEIVKEKWGIVVSRPKCQSARKKALKWIEMEYDRQFRRLRDYAAEVLQSNPQSSVAVETYRDSEGRDVFDRFYVCFDVLRKTWQSTCRPVIGVDGCFLKSKTKGQLLAAIGRDANNCIYPIAWAVVQIENTANWHWFVMKLKADLGLRTGAGFVLVSDRQKGLINAVEEELPNIEHRMCVRHIYANLKAKHGKIPEMKKLVWRLSWSYNDEEYNKNLRAIRMYDQAVYDDVIKAKPKHWCRAFYKIGSRCEDVHNNFTESFNASIVKAREKPLVPMLELIARQAMVRINTRYMKAVTHEGQCTPYATTKLTKEKDLATECRVFTGTNRMHQVVCGTKSYQVSLDSWTCSCKKWDIRGIPCAHGYAAILDKTHEVEDYVCQWFKTSMWRRNYENGIIPARGEGFWPKEQGQPVHMPPAPPQPGRKKKSKAQKRKKGVNESPTKKSKAQKRILHCSVCGSSRHNCRAHKPKASQASGSQASATVGSEATVASQMELSQASGSQAPVGSQPTPSPSQPCLSQSSV